MRGRHFTALLALQAVPVITLRYNPDQVRYNLNQNETATNPIDYWGKWENHTFHPSPQNWRFPFYSLFLDRFANGDPTNDDIDGTAFERDPHSNQLRHGGDVAGIIDSLDYIQGMGIKGIYIAGTILINLPWVADGYSPIDLTLLDGHYGDIEKWRSLIAEIHHRGMYVIMDNTLATLSDLIGFEGYLNSSTPFALDEHKAVWKSDRRYPDFDIGNEYNETCIYPRFWKENGYRVGPDVTDRMRGCYNSEFDQYGDSHSSTVIPVWQKQLSKFAGVQDRLREWVPSVRAKIERHFCLMITMLDIDGFRYDKATHFTVDALADISQYYRECARSVGKTNFFIPGEIAGGDTFGSIYLGRGRQPDMRPANLNEALTLTNHSTDEHFIRPIDRGALDAAAFHRSIYRSLTRFLGLSGDIEASFDVPVRFVDAWNTMLVSNDFVNVNTGKFDPRHMYGSSNQDVFRWPSIRNGTEKWLLGLFITTLHMPGIPKLIWGEEQAFYLLDSTSPNYIFGRQPMSSATAWQTHGCFTQNSTKYLEFPLEAARDGCNDDTQSYDHRDPSHQMRNIIKSMYHMRENYPALQDGFLVAHLSNQTREVLFPGSDETATEKGVWSVVRGRFENIQDLGTGLHGNQSVWLVYQNDNKTVDYQFNCSDKETALIAPFDEGTTVKNLFHPHDEKKLKASSVKYGFDGSDEFNGCLDHVRLDPWEFRAYVPKSEFTGPRPMITGFFPGHDARILSDVKIDEEQSMDIELHFSAEMDCESVTRSLKFDSSTENGISPSINADSIRCGNFEAPERGRWIGEIVGIWRWSAELTGIRNGIHRVTVNNASSLDGESINAIDHFLFRVGQFDNPLVFTRFANYSDSLLHRNNSDDSLYVSHHASGAGMYRYSLTWGSAWSAWLPYRGGNSTLSRQPWSGTKQQEWIGEHVIVQYWDRMSGSSAYEQHGDLDYDGLHRRFPHLYWNGHHNQYGYDAGITNQFELERFRDEKGQALWKYRFMTEWPAAAQVNVWGMNPDGRPDQTMVYGDVDRDSVLDRVPPSAVHHNLVSIPWAPPRPHLAWTILVNDATLRLTVDPVGAENFQLLLYVVLWIVPTLTGAFGIWAFMKSFYQVKFNQVGIVESAGFLPVAIRRKLKQNLGNGEAHLNSNPFKRLANKVGPFRRFAGPVLTDEENKQRRMVLLATMEYDIEDWDIKIKIGGLGMMAQLMGKNLDHLDLIWVVPCVGGVEYPQDRPAEPMSVSLLGDLYEIEVQYHYLRNITYVLLDAPVFRRLSKVDPYPARMDDLDSAIYYSAWNQCIAQAIQRFPIDLYHINDYHGSIAPLYLLPQQTIPACLSLHNAEFQGLWPMRTHREREEVCSIFNLPLDIAATYVQFGDIFNLLHAAISYLRIHQNGFGAVGVSRKYSKRSYRRYPIFWGLEKVGKLPNPDPYDTAALNPASSGEIQVDPAFEADRGEIRRKAQEWAGLDQDPDADLCVFVGRWSMQKGVDLIADVFPSILDKHPQVQLLCIGPVIDLYGKFAALKLEKVMKMYPSRVVSKPEYTTLPPYLFSGAEFVLIPSRDEPFGLVAVEFGRKGALGIGARVGGLGQMPGWWYTVESTTTGHLLQQFRLAIESALSTKRDLRALMRARSARQRFPVAKWLAELENLQRDAIKIHHGDASNSPYSTHPTPSGSGQGTPTDTMAVPLDPSRIIVTNECPSVLLDPLERTPRGSVTYSRDVDPSSEEFPKTVLGRQFSLPLQSRTSSQQINTGQICRSGQDPSQVIVETNNEALGALRTDPGDCCAVEGRPSYDIGDDTHALPYENAAVLQRMDHLHQNGATSLHPLGRALRRPLHRQHSAPAPLPDKPEVESPPPTPSPTTDLSRNSSVLSIETIVGSRKDFELQRVDPTFTDRLGEYHRAFEQKLEKLNGGNSESHLCIEKYLVASEKQWFGKFRDARLGRRGSTASLAFFYRPPAASSPLRSIYQSGRGTGEKNDEFFLGENYTPPTGLKKMMLLRIGDWPVYSIFLAFGQIMAANSYQITLLTGQVGQSAQKLYIVASIYLATSILWWFIFRFLRSVISLSLPFAIYGLAFAFIGSAHYASSESARGWIQNIGTGLYAAASSSGSIFFALNFGDGGVAPVKDWVFRSCVIQGTQQIYVIGLWYWGAYLTKNATAGMLGDDPIVNTWIMSAVTFPIALGLWAIGMILFLGLPDYYHQAPGKVPSFYKSLFRRRIIVWFFVTVVIQNFFLSAPYGRNWAFLWSSQHAKTWQIVLLALLFFVVVWAIMLGIFCALSKNHNWILPVFAIGLGCPRWAQIWWGTSNIGLYLPWAGSYTTGALASRSLWLWLGVLDAMQGVGFGMILLQTLTRMHICFTLLAAQALGSIATISARAFAPNRIGPGPISPDISGGLGVLWEAWFWVGLGAQLVICAGFFLFFRKEQLSKP